MLVTSRIEIETPIGVLLTLLRAGVRIMKLNGKSRFYEPENVSEQHLKHIDRIWNLLHDEAPSYSKAHTH